MKKYTALDVFFFCLGIDLVISSVKVNFHNLTVSQILDNLFFSFMYNFIIAIPAALAAMVIMICGQKLMAYLKKNLINEILFY